MRKPRRETLMELRHPAGVAAICKEERDGSLWITSDLEDRDDLGDPLELHGLTQAIQIDDVQIVGGRLPPNAHSVEVRTGDEILVEPVIGPGVWLAALRAEADFDDPRTWVLFNRDPPLALLRDAEGEIVAHPLAQGARVEPLEDADSPCAACGGRDWVRLVVDEAGGATKGMTVLACRRCGHREAGGGPALVATRRTDLDEPDLEGPREDEQRAEIRRIRRQLRGVPLPLYGLAPSWRGGRLIQVVNRHRRSGSINLFHGERWSYKPPYVDIENLWGAAAKRPAEARAREGVFRCLLRAPESSSEKSPEASRLAFHTALRDRRRLAAMAELSTRELFVDDEPVEFLVAHGDEWVVAAGFVAGLGLTLIGRGVPLGEIELAKVEDLEMYLGAT